MKNHSLLNFVIFTCFLVVGYTISTRFYPVDARAISGSLDTVTSENQDSIAALDNGQRSFLLISASSLNTSNQQLDGIWLATYFATDPTIHLLPIFPTGKQQLSGFEAQLQSTFAMDKENGTLVPAAAFTDLLENNNYWWSGYLVFDEVALSRVLDFVGYIEVNEKILSGTLAYSQLIGSPRDAYPLQVAILQSACRKLSGFDPGPDASQIISSLPGHIFTDLDTYQLQMELETLYSGERTPTCTFPTLDVLRIDQ